MRRVVVRNKLLRPLRERQFHAFGPDSLVDRPAWLYGPAKISIGAGVVVLRGCWLAAERVTWERPGPALVLGDGVAMRPGCTLAAADSIVLGEHVGMGAYVTIIDSRHTWSAGHVNVLYSPVAAAPIHIGAGTWLADRATVAAGAQIGERCAIGPNSVVSGKVPDHSMVLGNPGRVVGSTRA